jgi:hypothetical protein
VPEVPFGDKDAVRAFLVIVAQLRRLSRSEKGSFVDSKLCHILEMLVKTQSCAIPVMLANRHVLGAEKVFISLFDTLIFVVERHSSLTGKTFFCKFC